ncbi:cytochrome P450 [Aspergillus bertholletiae]|uniref:Cytochrome P450 n=1 Tax=Aspergillus bertholletiae TaxID=1226010 RepID=A0A5N7BKV9_9EURO|nr:cytochrome P450 [Aspergillus bertholletiae]
MAALYLLFGAALVLYTLSVVIYNLYIHPLKDIPGPFLARITRWWLFVLEMRGNPHSEILELHKEYGVMMRISPNEISIADLEASSVIYGQTSKFEKSHYFYRSFEDQASNLFTIRDRQQHSQDKRLISHAFSRANIIQHQTSIYDHGLYLMDKIAQRAENDRTIPLFNAFRCMTLDTISDFAFGKSTDALKSEDFHSVIFDGIDNATHSVPFFQHFPILRELLRWSSYYNINSVPNGFLKLGQVANDGFQEMDASDTWTMFKNMIASAGKKSQTLSKEHLIAEAIVMIVAGTDTTAVALSTTLHKLLQMPEIYQKLQDEIRTIMPSINSQPAFDKLDALPLLDACLKEGLRISCPSRVRLPRTVPAEGWTFKGYHFPPGTIVFPSPMDYDPLRWIVDTDQKREMMSNFHPFSRGTRQCIGQR